MVLAHPSQLPFTIRTISHQKVGKQSGISQVTVFNLTACKQFPHCECSETISLLAGLEIAMVAPVASQWLIGTVDQVAAFNLPCREGAMKERARIGYYPKQNGHRQIAR